MPSFFQSAFLQSLGFAIANSIWQTALVWLMYVLANQLVTLSASAKYRLAVVAQLLSFTWFLFTVQFYYQQYNLVWNTSGIHFSERLANTMINGNYSSPLVKSLVKLEQILPYISLAYLILMLALCFRWFLGYRKTQLIRHTGLEKIPADWRAKLSSAAGSSRSKASMAPASRR